MMIVIRDADINDKYTIVDLIKEFGAEYKEECPVTASFVEKYLYAPNHHVLIAEWNKQAAGLLSYALRLDLWHAAFCCYIEDIIVKKLFRSKGIGSELIKSVMGRAKSAGYAEIALTVGQENIRAQELYKRLGINEVLICLEKHIK